MIEQSGGQSGGQIKKHLSTTAVNVCNHCFIRILLTRGLRISSPLVALSGGRVVAVYANQRVRGTTGGSGYIYTPQVDHLTP